ncbi:hypothetical protein QUF70_17000 [Desulfobacterales bacterium HSG17]|nr:hypothetical protein [Desulfobacterales bacterium HSG17]
MEFTVDISHSDELGGQLTSLIQGSPNTHFLVKDVMCDLEGRDSIKDFLAQYGQGFRLYESDNVDTDVTDMSESSTLTGAGETFTLSAPATLGFIYAKLNDPHSGQKRIKQVTCSDGKVIKPENAWLSKTRDKDNNWLYYLNIFDANTTDSYTITFEDLAAGPQPPVVGIAQDFTVHSGADVNADNKIDLEEAINALQSITVIETPDTEYSGQISTDTIWDSNIIKVTGDITIPPDTTLEITPGTRVEFQGNYKLTVNGTLLASGTAGQAVIFTPTDTDAGWQGIRFDSTDSLTENTPSKLTYCILQYANAQGAQEIDNNGGSNFSEQFSGPDNFQHHNHQ